MNRDEGSYQLSHAYTTAFLMRQLILAITPFNIIQGHRFGTNRKLMHDFLLVTNTDLHPVLHRFRDIAFDRSKIAIGYSCCV